MLCPLFPFIHGVDTTFHVNLIFLKSHFFSGKIILRKMRKDISSE